MTMTVRTDPAGVAARGDHLRAIPRRADRDGPPDPERLVRAVAAAFLEVEAGRRPLRQIERLLAPALRLRLQDTGRHRARPYPCGPDPQAVVNMRTDRSTADVVDAAVVVRRGDRVGALTVRVERHRGAWRVTDIARPETAGRAARTCSLPRAPAEPCGGGS